MVQDVQHMINTFVFISATIDVTVAEIAIAKTVELSSITIHGTPAVTTVS